MVNKNFLWAAAISAGFHIMAAGLLIFYPGPLKIMPRENVPSYFEISLASVLPGTSPAQSPKAALESQKKLNASTDRLQSAQSGRYSEIKPEIKPEIKKDGGLKTVVLASLGTLSDLPQSGKPTGSLRTGISGQLAGRANDQDASASVVLPSYSEYSRPDYPWLARIRGYEGVVLLAVEILRSGAVGNLTVKRSSGFALLDDSALKTVRKWKFVPGMKMGEPETMWVEVPVRFTLHD